MNVLFATAEAEPFIKTGGLADVAGSLPRALMSEGISCSVVLPMYGNIKNSEKLSFIKSFYVDVSWRSQYCGVFEAIYGDVKFYFIDNKQYFDREGLYGYYDDGERFAFFDRAVLRMIKELNLDIDILHCNDWQCGMIPFLLNMEYKKQEGYRKIKTVYSIHNLLFQGNFDPKILEELFGYSMAEYNNGSIELYGAASFMKAGINYADKISTVSESYANEIQTVEYGEKLEGLLWSRRADLKGILNGVDYGIYNPKLDNLIEHNYDLNCISKKTDNKEKLQEKLGLTINRDIPMIGMVSRLTYQKGMDLIFYALDKLLKENIQVVILGTGNKEYEKSLMDITYYHKNKVSANIFFSEKMARMIYASSDMFLMPSLFEPCGLGQIIALKYASIPIVRETGGLKDTIEPYNKYTGAGNGFSFKNYNGEELYNIIKYALTCYDNKTIWSKLIKSAMSCDYSWKESAKKYKELYMSI